MRKNLTHLLGLFFVACSAGVYAQAPVFTSNFYNPCGNDGNNEFLVGRASATAAFDPMKLYYFVSGANPDGSGRDSLYQESFCGSPTATGSGSSTCNAAGWTRSPAVGSASRRILDYTNTADQVSIDAVVARLNYRLASCAAGACSNTFVAPPAATGLIPAGAKFIFCISQGINDTAVGAGDAIDFCGFCGQGPFYVVVASFPPGATGLLTNTYTATTSRYIAMAYDYGGATGIAESQSYIHVPASSSVNGRNYLQLIPQGPDALTNATALNANTTDCNITAGLALPVTLTHFTGKYDQGTVMLYWSTASEQAADRFEIERSTDTRQFNRIGSVKATGNTATGADYTFTDPYPVNGTGYYRLKQLDINGKYAYSEILTLAAPTTQQGLVVAPNPAQDHIRLSITGTGDAKALLRLFNTSGTSVYQAEINLQQGMNTTAISLAHLAAGAYYLKVQTGQTVHNQVVIKQ